MPAISLSYLRLRAARLAERFDDPAAFLADLMDLLESCQDRTRRKLQTIARSALPTFRAPAPVLRQILIPLAPLAEEQPLAMLALTDALWQAGYLETRLLAATLVGYVPPENAMPLYSRLGEWLDQTREQEIQDAILNHAFSRLRREQPEVMLHLVEEWLGADSARVQIWGFQALALIVKAPGFEDLPRAFRLLRPALQKAGPATQVALADCLEALCSLSPVEAAAFLGEVVRDRPRSMMVRTLRRIQPRLPLAVQRMLSADLRVVYKAQNDALSS